MSYYDQETDSDLPPSPPRKVIIVIDDTLDMELKKHGLMGEYDTLFHVLHQKDLMVVHARDQESALHMLARMKKEYLEGDNRYETPIAPENITVISDYKIQHPGTPEEWGPDILTAMAADPEYRPANLFLMSKSGFRGEDQPKLDAIGAKYFHTNEFFFAVAAQAKNEALMEVFSQRATTHNFREWYNQQFGTELALDQYRSPNVAEAEKGRIPVSEVIRRIEQENISHVEAMQMLDETSVAAAFRSRVDVSGAKSALSKKIEHGIQGPSVCGRLAYSEADIEQIRAEMPDAPIVLVLDHDYSPADTTALSHANGVLMLAKGTQHIQIWAKDARIPVLFANKEKYPDFSVEGEALRKHDGLGAPEPFAKKGDWVSIDGSTLTLHGEKLPIQAPAAETLHAAQEMAHIGNYHNRLTWHFKNESDNTISDHSGVGVMVNASSAEQVRFAKTQEAVRGIGLLRTEPMFRSDERRLLLLKALLSEGEAKQQALTEFTRLHAADLEPVFAEQTAQFPINVRLFDFPPEEFFPNPSDEGAITATAEAIGVDAQKVKDLCKHAYDSKLRGAGFALAYPEIAQAQAEAIFDAAAKYPDITPRILVPAVRSPEQLKHVRTILKEGAHKQKFQLGTMVETADLMPKEHGETDKSIIENIVRDSDFLCFGTNDLTEELLGIKRGDIESQIAWGVETRSAVKPFNELTPSVMQAIAGFMWRAREVKPTIPFTLCGDQATHRATAGFCQLKNFHALSVPATQEAVTQAMVETGRASLLEAVEHRQKLDADLEAQRRAHKALEAGVVPEEVKSIAQDVLKDSPIAFIVLEDNRQHGKALMERLEGYPVLMSDNISDGLKTAAAMRKRGKQVHLITDANILARSMEDYTHGTGHPDCAAINTESSMPFGVQLAWAAYNGKIEGFDAPNITLVSAFNTDRLPEGVTKYSKLGDYFYDNLRDDMDAKIKALHSASAAVPTATADISAHVIDVEPEYLEHSPIGFIVIEDSEAQRKHYREDLEGLPVVICSNVSDALITADAMRAQGKLVHIYTDAGVPPQRFRDDDKPHPACKTLRGMEDSNHTPDGVLLVRAIHDGKIPGLSAGDISVISTTRDADMYTPNGVKFFAKSGNLGDHLAADMADHLSDVRDRAIGGSVKLPKSATNIGKDNVVESPVTFVMIGDKHDSWIRYESEFGEYPLVLCEDEAAALEATKALQAEGKQVQSFGSLKNSDIRDVKNKMDAELDALSQPPQTTVNTDGLTLTSPQLKLPEHVGNISPYTLNKSSAAFIFIEDERQIEDGYRKDFRGRPVLLCTNVNDALKTMDVLQAQGKHVSIITDANVPAAAYQEKELHPFLAALKRDDEKPASIALVEAIVAGMVPGLKTENVSVVSSFNTHRLPPNVHNYDKFDSAMHLNMADMMNRFTKQADEAGPYVKEEVKEEKKRRFWGK